MDELFSQEMRDAMHAYAGQILTVAREENFFGLDDPAAIAQAAKDIVDLRSIPDITPETQKVEAVLNLMFILTDTNMMVVSAITFMLERYKNGSLSSNSPELIDARVAEMYNEFISSARKYYHDTNLSDEEVYNNGVRDVSDVLMNQIGSMNIDDVAKRNLQMFHMDAAFKFRDGDNSNRIIKQINRERAELNMSAKEQ